MKLENQLVIFEDKDKKIEVQLKEETIWLTLNQIATIFDKDKSVISRHIRNIFKSGELNRNSTVAKFATVQIEGKRRVKRTIEYFNLDVIIAVGYRVNSKKATQFRIWATNVLKNYLIKGYAVNEKRITQERLKELENTIKFIKENINTPSLTSKEAKGLIEIIEKYALVCKWIDVKAANLLYLIIKNHPFVDGNKRIGALLFLQFLYENSSKEELFAKFNSNTLTALCYLVAASPPEQKEQLIKLIMNFISFDERFL